MQKCSGDIKFVQERSIHAQVDMVVEVYGHIIDEDGWKIAKMREDDFYSKENLNLNISGSGKKTNMFLAPEGVDTELQTKIFAKPEVVVSLSSLVKTIK
jgi:putative DNA integration/recombination/invertion protein